jgi:IS30 family transposase
MPKGYHHLTYAQRCQICLLKDREESQRSIGKELNIHPSTVGRELKRNSGQRGYRHKQA